MNKIGHYNGYSEANGLGFTSGIVGVGNDGLIVKGLAAQVEAAIHNLSNILEANNVNLSHVIKTTVFIVNNDDYVEMDYCYKQAFGTHAPARSVVIVNALPQVESDGPEQVLFEIEAVVATLSDYNGA